MHAHTNIIDRWIDGLQDLMYRYTLDSIGKIAFGIDLGINSSHVLSFLSEIINMK
jgi:hypothetical protein